MNTVVRRAVLIFLAAAIIIALVMAFRPRAVKVEGARAQRGPMVVTVDDEGQTRIRERYVVAAPLEGQLRRIELEPGDAISADASLIALIDPTPPGLLDVRQIASAEAQVHAAEAGLQRAEALFQRAESLERMARTDLTRVSEASEQDAATAHEMTAAVTAHRVAEQELRSASFSREVARYELELARSALVTTHRTGADSAASIPFEVRAPINGKVLRVFQKSAGPTKPGTPLVEIGDPEDLEVVVDVLSRDAARIAPGTRALLEDWGGDAPLDGMVRLVEPAGFTKVSSLGIEEQRVNVLIDLLTPYAQRSTLGDGYRVEARLVVWEAADVLKVPSGAIFRTGNDWTVFEVSEGRAQRRIVTVGHQNAREVEIIDGLKAGALIIVHPNDRVTEGGRIEVDPPAP